MSVAAVKELYSLLIPLRAERLLVPRMCVAEVIAFADAARNRDAAAPEWFLGWIEWNNRRVPVVSFDGSAPDERRSKRSRARVVVFIHGCVSATFGNSQSIGVWIVGK